MVPSLGYTPFLWQERNGVEKEKVITEEERKAMAQGNGGSLNPDWVEWLMSVPTGWTDIDADVPIPARPADVWWPPEPGGVPRIAKGIAHRADRLKCLGNAVVPPQFYPIFAAIAEIEQEAAQ